jgi:hypothetical protein
MFSIRQDMAIVIVNSLIAELPFKRCHNWLGNTTCHPARHKPAARSIGTSQIKNYWLLNFVMRKECLFNSPVSVGFKDHPRGISHLRNLEPHLANLQWLLNFRMTVRPHWKPWKVHCTLSRILTGWNHCWELMRPRDCTLCRPSSQRSPPSYAKWM